MLTLAEIQSAMREAVIAAPGRTLLDAIVSDRIPARARLKVYRNHYRVSLKEGLARVFPAARVLLGERYFDAMAALFIAGAPPRDPRIALHGGDFPRFLASRDELEDLPFVVEVARLEWLLAAIADVADEPPLGLEDLARVQADPAAFRLRLARTVALFDCEWPVHAIRRSALAEGSAAAVAALLEAPPPTRLLLHRDADGDPCETVVDAADHAALRALRAGRTVAEAARAAAAVVPDHLAGDLLEFLFRSGLVTGLSASTATHAPRARAAKENRS